jgi:hypothetical protein
VPEEAVKPTAREFMTGYAQRSKATPEGLFAEGLVVATCHCDYEGCEGWQMTTLQILETFGRGETLALTIEDWKGGT